MTHWTDLSSLKTVLHVHLYYLTAHVKSPSTVFVVKHWVANWTLNRVMERREKETIAVRPVLALWPMVRMSASLFSHGTITLIDTQIVQKYIFPTFNPFTAKSDQFQISPAASPEILHHTVWRTWLFIAYTDDHLYNVLFEFESKRIDPFTPELKKCILPTFQKAIVWVM